MINSTKKTAIFPADFTIMDPTAVRFIHIFIDLIITLRNSWNVLCL